MKKATRYLLLSVRLSFIVFLAVHTPLYAQKDKKSSVKGYGKASYASSETQKFMKEWLVLGPVPMSTETGKTPDDAAQIAAFDNDIQLPISVLPGKTLAPVSVDGKTLEWRAHSTTTRIIDFDVLFNKLDFVSAYALAEIRSDADRSLYLALGSDDGVKVWLNGKQIHRNWVPRGITPDEDLVPLKLVKGTNQIVLKVQDMEYGWGFTARLLDNSDRLIIASAKGDLDLVNQLLTDGVDLTKKNASGLTAYSAAQLQGRTEVMDLLVKKGAQRSALPSGDLLIDDLYSSLVGQTVPGVSLLVAKDGKIIYKKAFGYENIEKKIPASPDTKFRIGSITKQFTGAAILRLQEQGKLSVNDKLSKYLPDFPRGDEVTIHHLLTHTSGIHSYTSKPDFMNKVTSPVSSEELINYFKNDQYDFNPGEQWSYNNSAYFMLGFIIEKVSGKTYAQYLKDTFFDPLQMTNTGVHDASLKLQHEAIGYERASDGYKPSANWNMTWAGGAGALYSTTEDLYRWNEALFSGKVLKEESLKAAFTPVKLNNGERPANASYGYGWAIDEYRGRKLIHHSGGLHGFNSNMARFADDGFTFVILTNISPSEVNMSPNPIGEFYLSDKMASQQSYSVKAGGDVNVRDYEGRYDFGSGMVMTVTSEGSNLFAQLSGQPKFPIFPAERDRYFWKVVEARIKFIRDEKGVVTGGDFEQGAAKLKVARLKEEMIVKLDPVIFEKYKGKYDFGNSIVITISTKDGKIFAQATNQPALELLPLSEKEFTIKEMNGKVTFAEDGGKVNKFVLDMGGQKRDIMKIE